MHDLIAAYWMISGHRPTPAPEPSPYPLLDRARAASAAGYRGMGLGYGDLLHNVRIHGYDGIRAILDDHGIVHREIETLMGWHLPDQEAVWRPAYDFMLEAADRLGVRVIKAGGDFSADAPDAAAMADAFAPLAPLAAQAGTVLGLEIIAFSNIPDVPTARRVLGDTVGKGGGLMLDCWHFGRRGLGLDQFDGMTGEEIAGVEFSDLGPEVVGDLFEDTVDHRRLPGDGVYDIPAFLAAAFACGYRGPVGCEVLSRKLRAIPLEKAARLSFQAAHEALEIAFEHNR